MTGDAKHEEGMTWAMAICREIGSILEGPTRNSTPYLTLNYCLNHNNDYDHFASVTITIDFVNQEIKYEIKFRGGKNVEGTSPNVSNVIINCKERFNKWLAAKESLREVYRNG